MRELTGGETATMVYPVAEIDSARHWRNDLPVLATPVLLWLAEVTAMQVLGDHLDDGEMTVGVAHDAAHLAPTPIGQSVTLVAVYRERRGSKLVFDIEGHDNRDVVYRGTHTRAVVERSTFVAMVEAKAGAVAQPVPISTR